MEFLNIMDCVNRMLPLPEGETEDTLFSYLSSYCLNDVNSDSKKEVSNYLKGDFKRFVHTLGLIPNEDGKLLEIGANPYYMSMLISKFRKYQSIYTNYFHTFPDKGTQCVVNEEGQEIKFDFCNVNLEEQDLPFDPKSFDVVLFCEVLEHLPLHPMKALLNIKKCLKKDGYLILTTPNVNRLENVARMLQGTNIYDPCSAHGIHGRHNREYNRHELDLLLNHLGFEIEEMFSADVHENNADSYYALDKLTQCILETPNRKYDLGQYVFVRAKNVEPASEKLPRWLYQSYPTEMLT